jgi:hypothetical protein
MVERAGQSVVVCLRLPAQSWWLVRGRCHTGRPGTFPGEPVVSGDAAIAVFVRGRGGG